jgi:hypothetical protein
MDVEDERSSRPCRGFHSSRPPVQDTGDGARVDSVFLGKTASLAGHESLREPGLLPHRVYLLVRQFTMAGLANDFQVVEATIPGIAVPVPDVVFGGHGTDERLCDHSARKDELPFVPHAGHDLPVALCRERFANSPRRRPSCGAHTHDLTGVADRIVPVENLSPLDHNIYIVGGKDI